MSKYLYSLLVLLLLVGCRSSEVFSYCSKSDTTITTISKYDSIIYRDSIYIYDRDTIKYVYKQRDNYHVKQHHDTIYKIYHDTIYLANVNSSNSKLLHRLHGFSTISVAPVLTIAILLLLIILLFIYKKFK